MRDTIKAFKALSDETRLRILNVLLERECCVCEVMQALDISQSRASRNLGALYDAGFLKLKKRELKTIFGLSYQAGRMTLLQNGLIQIHYNKLLIILKER